MRKHEKFGKVMVVKIVLIAAVSCAVFGAIVMFLWNWLMPTIFGLRTIGFWQAAGLLILSRILFRGFYGSLPGRGPWRHRMTQHWAQMTPEEREAFREGLRRGFGPDEPSSR